MNIKQQQGIGLIEVMVALLLLAIAVMGFSALQMHAVGATDESLVRTRGTSTVRALSESMRNNMKYLPEMADVINGTVTFNKDCMKDTCDEKQTAQYTANEMKNRAAEENFKVSMVDCPGVKTIKVKNDSGSDVNVPRLYCAIIAWGTTQATLGSGADDCADAASGSYNRGSTCLIMETY